MQTTNDKILLILQSREPLTAAMISKEVYGPNAKAKQIHWNLSSLLHQNKIKKILGGVPRYQIV